MMRISIFYDEKTEAVVQEVASNLISKEEAYQATIKICQEQILN